jgi:drug/metabolite transporter (DMT)-like permease
MNLSIILSILCAIAWGLQAIFLKMALRDIPLYSAVLISLAINFLIVAVFIGAGSEKGFSAFYAIPGSAYVYFMIAGVLNYFLGRTFYYSSFRFIGVAQATSISSTYPIFSVVLAILFLSEKLAVRQYFGVSLTLVGIYLLLLKGKR